MRHNTKVGVLASWRSSKPMRGSSLRLILISFSMVLSIFILPSTSLRHESRRRSFLARSATVMVLGNVGSALTKAWILVMGGRRTVLQSARGIAGRRPLFLSDRRRSPAESCPLRAKFSERSAFQSQILLCHRRFRHQRMSWLRPCSPAADPGSPRARYSWNSSSLIAATLRARCMSCFVSFG